ncbi:MAG: T9SS type A sorting domain-containing protein [Candidatus Eisenbacteria bacterium]|nr:T9SS type A sorting domain-containing protein [Candidatus Eisenbacteria bacterium]
MRALLRCESTTILLAAVLIGAMPSVSGAEVLIGRRGEPPATAATLGAPKVFRDELPKVDALTLAASRGRARGERTTVRLLAIRVDFQPDTDRRSTGTGAFDYSESDSTTFDGPPHDKEYFELHMTALSNYYSSVSYGRVEIEFAVAPEDPMGAFTLPHDMGYYHDYSEEQVWYVSQVEAFTRDAFAAADTTGSIDFSQYDGYVIFHAGADWQSDIGFDSPFDLPSAHIMLGEPIVVNDGAWEVWNAAIMPETSSQDGLTMVLNGTLAHEVGHVFGLPDLYNTSNFFPEIGYWGIMDSGGSIGMDTPWGWAYGILPASPCAWSKEYMGWLDPVVILNDMTDVSVKATELRGSGFRLFKIPITSDEYFLVENRLDDLPDSHGNVDSLLVGIDVERGVVLGPVDPFLDPPVLNHEYDFLLPGPGLVIYHIDDTRVLPGLMPYDSVNADHSRRGVAIEEADGIMDLGNVQSFYWTGSRYDPFFAAYDGQGELVHSNRFSWHTYPSTDTNMGARTYVSVSDISEPGTVMTMDVHFDRWKEGWPISVDGHIGALTPRVADLDGDGDGEIVVATREGDIYAWHHDGTPVISLCGLFGRFASVPGGVSHSPALEDVDMDGDAEVIVASDAGSLYVWDHEDDNLDGFADLHSASYPSAIDGPASSNPVPADVDGTPGLEIAVTSVGGDLTIVDHAGAPVGASPYSFGHLVLNDVSLAAADLDLDGLSEVVMSTTNRGWIAALNADGTSLQGWPVTVDSWKDEQVQLVIGDIQRSGDGAMEVVAVGSDGIVHVWDRRGVEIPGWPVDIGRRVDARPSLADLDGDGHLEIVIPAGPDEIWGLRSNGTRVEDWPLAVDPGDSTRPASATALVGDIDADGEMDVLAAGPGGSVFAWRAVSGDPIPGWPYSSDPALGAPWAGDIDLDGQLDLLVAGSSGRVLLSGMPYEFEPGGMVWSSEGGNAAGTGAYPDSLMPGAPEQTATLMAYDRTYCYPNPARGSDLTIRVCLEEEARIDVDILDVTGQIVEHMERDGTAPVNEIRWNTTGVASGLYIVRVQATEPMTSGAAALVGGVRSESKTMKVALIR